MSDKLWGGRFSASTDSFVNDFQSSIRFDARLYRQDIEGSLAHSAMLARQGIIGSDDAERIKEGLLGILADIEAGRLSFSADAEDIHMNVESELTARIAERQAAAARVNAAQGAAERVDAPQISAPKIDGEANAGKKLHTARSRNDQVALDIRMYLMEDIEEISRLVCDLVDTILEICKKHTRTAMPGYTHLQRAQPITFAHHMAAYAEMLLRDVGRLADCYARTDSMPLGSGAMAGVTYPVDRRFVADALGFSAITNNSLDAVSDRDFALELMSALSIIMVHLSRGCEELVLWSSQEFGFIELSDEHTTGSSIMPQKKNPDAAELIRGKSGRVFGDLMSLLVTMKGLPLAYNKDMQEDKEAVFDATDTAKLCLEAYRRMLLGMSVNAGVMSAAAIGGFANATDLADYLARKGLPFREAHEVVGRLVRLCVDSGRALADLTIDEMRAVAGGCSAGGGDRGAKGGSASGGSGGAISGRDPRPLIDADVYAAISLDACLAARETPGGPAPAAMEAALANAAKRLAAARESMSNRARARALARDKTRDPMRST